MEINSLYITHSAVISLDDAPLLTTDNIRDSFIPIFIDKNCYANGLTNFFSLNSKIPTIKTPFINNMGRVILSNRTFNFFKTNPYFDNPEDHEKTKNVGGYVLDGHIKELPDQRMYFFYFELEKPIKILAQFNGKTMASGRIFLHFYPTGYIIIHLAIYSKNISNSTINSESDLTNLIRETIPQENKKWKWKSTFGNLTLKETIDQVCFNITHSLYKNRETTLAISDWKTGVSISGDLPKAQYSQTIRKNINFIDISRNYDSIDSKEPRSFLFIRKNIHYYVTDSGRKRSTILHSIWMINKINEFLLFKKHVYVCYQNHLSKDRKEINNFILNRELFFHKANIFGKNYYNEFFYYHLEALDDYTKMFGSKYRAIYAKFSESNGFNKERAKLLQELKDWKQDIEKWMDKDPLLMQLLEKGSGFLSPSIKYLENLKPKNK